MADGSSGLAACVTAAPVLADPDLAAARLDDWLASLPQPSRLGDLAAAAPVRALLLGIADHSPFLWRLAMADPARLADLLAGPPDAAAEHVNETLDSQPWDHGLDKADLLRTLRRARQATALLVALADLGGVWPVERVTEVLTRFADAAVRTAIRALLREAVRTGRLLPGEDVEAGCGLTVLALGKQGAVELNYSSDIDLVVLFDPKATRLPESTSPPQFFVRLTQQFIRLMQDRTEDGYVLRTDLRLRPDPASTAVAIALPSAFSYYENYGQNWERAAFIKARPVAGDRALGQRFLDDLAPFIWRKYFDYAAIADVHAMKRQIHAVRGQATIAVAGHNIKLGRGGIREIEFFVQTQQLIFGGRRPHLRRRQTLAMLEALKSDGWIDAGAVAELSQAYRFLRRIEHRLQMVADEQTQRLPETDAALEGFARFAGFATRDAFAAALTHELERVEAHYARLFEHAPGLDTDAGSLVFTGTSADPETLETLRAMGFTRPETAVEIIRGWHFGRRAAVQSARAREIVTELTPALLDAFAGSSDPDAALATMDTMLGRIIASVELLSLLKSNTALRELFADILGSAPRLAATIAARPHVLDAAIDPAAQALSDTDVVRRVRDGLGHAATLEDFLDRSRDLAQEERFLVGVRLLSGALEPAQAGAAFSLLADTILQTTWNRCAVVFAAEHGHMPGGGAVVLGMGKLGSQELTATSDLDLIVVYRFDPDGGPSDGPRPLDGVRYYTRLTQRLIAALTAMTRRGRLYDVDVRLRPSGRQGPLAAQFGGFVAYQQTEAQTWEHMALSRARVVAGDPALAGAVQAAVTDLLRTPRNPAALQHDIRTMRALVAKEKGDAGFFDMKLVPGGLLDIEFAAQFLVLRFGATHPGLLVRHPLQAIAEAARLDLLPASQAEILERAFAVQTALAQLTRLTVEGTFDAERVGAGVLRRLCAAVNEPDLSALRNRLAELRRESRRILQSLLAWSDGA